MATMTAATRLFEFADGLRTDDLPAEVAEAASLHLLDALGCAIAAVGSGQGGWAAEVASAQGGVEESTVIGGARRLPAAAAAMANGVAAHALDFDDTHGPSVCHVSAVVGPAAMALAEARGTTGDDLLAAYVAGAEVTCRIGMAAPGGFHARGFHSTSVCGTFGAAVAAARLLRLDHEGFESAIGIAGSFSSGLLAFLSDGSQTKPLHAGWAAHAGIQAALLAAAGAEGPGAVLEDANGFFAAFAAGDPAVLAAEIELLGVEWETPRISFKAYPACHFVHAAVDAAAAAAARLGDPRPADIAAVEARVSDTGVGLVLDPLADKLTPRTPYDAKFSLPYCVATRLVHGCLDLASFAPSRLDDQAVLALARRFSYTAWTVAEAPAPFAGEVTLRLRDGREAGELVPHPRGSIENPMDAAAVEAKFRADAALALDPAEVETVLSSLRSVVEREDLGEVLAPLARARRSEVRL